MRRAWIEITLYGDGIVNDTVALREESVDRNAKLGSDMRKPDVALREESVDRNFVQLRLTARSLASLSVRRAWIENPAW